MLPISLQLYTVRDLTTKDFAGTVKKVATIGYRAVELAGYGNMRTPADAKKALDDAGLRVSGAHAGIDALESELNRVLDEAALFGTDNIICPFMPEARRENADAWKSVGASLTKIGDAIKQRGLNFAYHNHSFEFERFGGKSGMEILLESSDPQLVKMELDVYWLKHGGEDPVAFINKLGSRTLLVHLKDMAGGPERRFAPVGTGILDFKSILSACEKAGVKWGIVEQDNCYLTPPLDAVKVSFENLKKLS
jgi:sugar phosphate isomerase/epimerase